LRDLRIQPLAERDLRGAAVWYRERDRKVAERFLAEVERTLKLIELFPDAGSRIPAYTGRARRLPVDTFPYHVVFEAFLDRIEVLAIAHDRRRPGYWSS
jgi:toxin ParE1/3/4